MNQEVEIQILNINGKDYFLLDTLGDGNTYYYFSNLKDTSDVVVLKDQETNFASIEDKNELNYAFSLFYDKYRDYDVVAEG